MARKGERYHQVPTLWHIGTGYPCSVLRRRRVRVERPDGTTRWQWRWERRGHAVLTLASARRWARLRDEGHALIRRDGRWELAIQLGLIETPQRQDWAR